MILRLALSLGAVVLALAIASRRHGLGTRRWWTLRGLVESTAATVGFPVPDKSFATLADVCLEGRLPSRREAWVSFHRPERGRGHLVRFEVAADEAPAITVTEANAVDRVRHFFGLGRGLALGDRSFDQRFVLGAPDPERARRTIGHDLRQQIAAVFDRWSVRSLRLDKGRLSLEAWTGSVELETYPRVFERLDEVARVFDRAPVKVRVLGVERRALTDHDGRLRCAYCHEGITGEEDALVACERCATVLHAPCWDEHGGCPVFGCRGERAERSPTR